MSKSLVKKALYVVESDDEQDNGRIKGHDGSEKIKFGSKKARHEFDSRYNNKKRGRSHNELPSRQSRLDEYREKQAEDQTKDNLKLIKKLRSDKIEKNLATNLLIEMGKIDIPKDNQPVRETNFVTEDDFKRYVKQCLK